MKTMYKYLSIALVALLMAACVEHIPEAEPLPQEAASFTYLILGDYALDYYVDSEIEFVNTSYTQGTATWNFGDESEILVGDTVRHAYDNAKTYTVTLTITDAQGKTLAVKKQPLMISAIKPLMSINEIEGGLCEVRTTPVSFTVELPNPKNRAEKYEWSFPEGTTWADGSVIEGNKYESTENTLPQELKFAHVGSQTVTLVASLDGVKLEPAAINVQVAYFEEVPTLYYAVRGGNIMALKLVKNAPEGMKIYPFDLGVSSGQHPFTLLFEDSTLYMLDAGKQFYFVDDADGVLGDGKISAIAKDGSKVETVISNVGQQAFNDPFYGYIEDGLLYWANRNTGVVRMRASDRNKIYSEAEYPWFVQNATTNYYQNGITYGAIGGTFGKVEGTWYWTKFFNATGIFRFTDADILKSPISAPQTPLPAAGIALLSMHPKSYAYNKITKEFFFTLFDEGYHGVYRCEGIAALDAITKKDQLAPHKLAHKSGLALDINVSGSPALYEGTSSEPVGICQMAINEADSTMYFGYRPTPNDGASAPAGLMRYAPKADGTVGEIETIIEGIDVYGVVINPTPSKLF